MRNESSKPTTTIKDRIVGSSVVLLVGLTARLLYLNAIADQPTFGYLTFDLLHFNNVALAMLQGLHLGHEAVFKAPLYSMLLAQFYEIVSNPLFKALAVQCLLGSLSSVLVYHIAVHFYSQRVGITAGLIAALYGTLIYFDAELLPVTLTIFLILTALYLLLQHRENHRVLPLVGAGVALALAGAATPETLILVPVAAWWIYREPDHHGKSHRAHSMVLALAVIVVTTPFALVNNSRGGEKIPYLTDLSLRLATANQPQTNGRAFTLSSSSRELGLSYSAAVEASFRANIRELPITEMGTFWLKRTVNTILANPLGWIKLELRKLACLVSGYEMATDRPLYYQAQGAFPLCYLLLEGVLNIPLGIILPLALLAPLAARNQHRRQTLLLLSVIALSLVTLLFSVFAYQRLLMIPIVIIWAAAGLWGLIALYRQREYRRFYRWLLLLLVAAIITNGMTKIPGLTPVINSDFEGKMFLANSLLAANRLDESSAEYESALRIEPRSPRPYSSLAGIYVRQGDDSLATVYYDRAYGLDPTDDRPMRGIANILKRQQKLGELNHFLVQIIRDHPKANWAFEDYAYLHVSLQEYTQAADIFERAFAADSTYIEAIFRKGEVYLQADLRREAQQEFLRYLDYAPNSIAARANLGQTYARQQRIEEARREFDFVRSQQPGNPAAYFNLSTLYYQAKDLARSSSYLDTAAAIDSTFQGIAQMRQMLDSARAAAN